MKKLSLTEESAIREEMAKRRLELYRPYPKQIDFHNASHEYREILLRAGNQCISPWTFIETPDSMDLSSKVFFLKDARVLSWGGESECVAQISGGCVRGIEPTFRLVLESGHFFDCSSNHQILTSRGYCRIDQLMSQLDGLYLLHRDEDLMASYVGYGYLDGQQLHLRLDSDQEQFPSSGDVQERSLIFSREDAEGHIRQYTTILKECGHLATFDDVPPQLVDLFDLFSAPKVESPVLLLTCEHHNVVQFVQSLSCQPRSFGESAVLDATAFSQHTEQVLSAETSNKIGQCFWVSRSSLQFPSAQNLCCSVRLLNHDNGCTAIFYPFESPLLIGGGKIVSIVPIGYQPIIDCHVKDINNYKAAGVYHHNCGKTLAAAAQTAIFSTGRFPSWWKGRVWKRATVGWCAGVTGEVVRDSIQRLLLGDVANPGTGFIPRDDIDDLLPSRGVANLIDTIIVKNQFGGKSRIRLKYYEQGREKFQADSVDYVWLDEESPSDIYSESLTRTNATKGFLYMTFTPLKGMSEVVRKFILEPSPDRIDINMTIDDALHIPPEERAKIIASYPPHEREARTKGIPALGSGRIFPISEEAISCDAIPADRVPRHWQQIGGLDFGWDHPTAACKLLYDPENDVVYVTNTYRQREATPVIHAAALRSWGNLSFAWPHDGLQHDKGSGVTLAELYRQQGLSLLPERATFPDGSNGVEAGIAEMLMRMETGRFKVYRHLADFFEEFRLYHRDEGKVVKQWDDLLSSCRYALMMLRYAQFLYTPQQLLLLQQSGQHTSSYDACDRGRARQECGGKQKGEYNPDFRRMT